MTADLIMRVDVRTTKQHQRQHNTCVGTRYQILEYIVLSVPSLARCQSKVGNDQIIAANPPFEVQEGTGGKGRNL